MHLANCPNLMSPTDSFDEAKFEASTLDYLRGAKEVGIRTGKQPDRAVIIWAVVVGGVCPLGARAGRQVVQGSRRGRAGDIGNQ
jgi:hypothetical protein